MGEFSLPPPFSEPPSFFFFLILIFDLSDIITKIHPPFQNPGFALVDLYLRRKRRDLLSVQKQYFL